MVESQVCASERGGGGKRNLKEKLLLEEFYCFNHYQPRKRGENAVRGRGRGQGVEEKEAYINCCDGKPFVRFVKAGSLPSRQHL